MWSRYSVRNASWLILVIPYFSCFVSGLHIVDLTHEHSSSSISWPGNPDYNFTIQYRGETDAGFWYESNTFQTPEHTGTHVDAPAHFVQNGNRVEKIAINKLAGPGVVINVKSKVGADPDYRVTIDDLTGWENVHGRIPDGAVVLMNSGWAYKYPNKTLTFGSQSFVDTSTFHFPGWHEDTADWLVNNRNVHVVGVDTPSNDYGQSKTFPVHVILAAASINGVENVANLDSIPEVGTMIYVAVIKLHDGSGGPARVFATHLGNDTNSGTRLVNADVILALCLLVLLQVSLFC